MYKLILVIVSLFFLTSVTADGHLKSEKEVLMALDKYYEARNQEDYETVASMESKLGTYNTNSDGSFHKPRQITSVEDWKRTNQGGTTNVFYPEAVQISEDVVYVRFYFEGVLDTNGKTSDYRTRVTMNWIKEDGNWVVKSQHYSPANYGGVHITQAADFEE
tara:strand:+ start:65 stop:550 length:486 start_codon:yes stop_codon:yes gene_type:complete